MEDCNLIEDKEQTKLEDYPDIMHFIEFCGITANDVRDKTRKTRVVLVRHFVCLALRKKHGLTLMSVARLVNRKDHQSVIHACSTAEHLISNPCFKHNPKIAVYLSQEKPINFHELKEK